MKSPQQQIIFGKAGTGIGTTIGVGSALRASSKSATATLTFSSHTTTSLITAKDTASDTNFNAITPSASSLSSSPSSLSSSSSASCKVTIDGTNEFAGMLSPQENSDDGVSNRLMNLIRAFETVPSPGKDALEAARAAAMAARRKFWAHLDTNAVREGDGDDDDDDIVDLLVVPSNIDTSGWPRTLYVEDDEDELPNEAHVFLRKHLLEIYHEPLKSGEIYTVGDDPSSSDFPLKKRRRTTMTAKAAAAELSNDREGEEMFNADTEENKMAAKRNMMKPTHRACIRCAFCKPTLGKGIVRPRSLDGHQDFYIPVATRFNQHFSVCSEIPSNVLQKYEAMRSRKGGPRGRKEYWTQSGKAIGLSNIYDKAGKACGIAYSVPEQKH